MGINISAFSFNMNGDLNIGVARRGKKLLELIIYLFHNDNNINRFNVLPKIILLMEKEQKRNITSIQSINVSYDIRNGQEQSTSLIEMNSVKNIAKYPLSGIYYYSGIDYGTPSAVSIRQKDGFKKVSCEMREIKSSNGIKLHECGLPTQLQKGKSIENIQIKMSFENAFKFEHQEVINFYPLNYGKKIEKVSYNIKIHDVYDYDVDLREIYENKKTYNEKSIGTKDGKRIDDYLEYNFEFPSVNMSSIYYITINRK